MLETFDAEPMAAPVVSSALIEAVKPAVTIAAGAGGLLRQRACWKPAASPRRSPPAAAHRPPDRRAAASDHGRRGGRIAGDGPSSRTPLGGTARQPARVRPPARAESGRCRRSGAARAAPDRQGTGHASRQRARACLGVPDRAQRHRRFLPIAESRREAAGGCAHDLELEAGRTGDEPPEIEDETGGTPRAGGVHPPDAAPSCQTSIARP